VLNLVDPLSFGPDLPRPGEFVLQQRRIVELSFLTASKTSAITPALTRRRNPPMVGASFVDH